MSHQLLQSLSFLRKRALFLLLTAVCSIPPFMAEATHIVGGEIYYEDQGDGVYEITLIVYRDCGPANTNETYFDDLANIGVFQDGILFDNIQVDLFDAVINELPVELENPCFVLPPEVCVEQATYQTTVTLPPHPTGYTLTYQRCCRNPTIVNLVAPDDTGATFTTQIPGTNLVETNSNPQFDNFPPVALCANAEFFFDHGATDADGDSLVYTFCSPMLGGTPDAPMPAPPTPPPYLPVQWGAGFSATYPITSDPAFDIDPQTGEITGTPTQPGQFVIGICVAEYRDGVLLSATNRDFQFNVTMCDPTIIASIPEQEQFCDGLTFQFTQESVNATDFFWDFGEFDNDSDTSTDPSPEYTYSDTGVYMVTLIANPGWSCADTTETEYAAYPLISPFIFQSDFFCEDGNGVYGFEAQGEFDEDATFLWSFGDGASPAVSVQQNPSGVTFDATEEINITLTVSDNGCDVVVQESYEVPPAVEAAITPQESFCSGLTFQFEQESVNATEFQWHFGLPGNEDISTAVSPQFTYPDTGSYEVMLIASAPGACPDTAFAPVDIYWLLDPYFEAPDPQCFDGHSFTFTAEGTQESTAVYSWTFGDEDDAATSATPNPSGITFDAPGIYDVTLEIAANGCIDSYTAPVEVIANPTISFEGGREGCPDLIVNFDNLSTTATTAQYVWDFGDGSQSIAANPTHVYTLPGTYDVSLTMTTSGGCAEVLQETQLDIVTVYPEPNAAFNVEPNTVTLLEPHVSVTNLSESSVSCFYNFGDGNSTTECNPDYSYNGGGIYEIVQTVTNSFGCTDVAFGEVMVEGHSFFAPNAFTPDNDGINDVWLPIVTGASAYTLEVYNRWGEVIFSTNDPNEPWLGNVKGGEHFAQDGLYVYRAVLNDLVGLPHEFEGHVILLR